MSKDENSKKASNDVPAPKLRIPDDLMKYKRATDLMDSLEPFITLYNSDGSAAVQSKERTVGAVAAMNHLKRLDHPGLNVSEKQRMENQFRSFAAVAEAGMETLQGKHISLSLNAVGHRTGYSSLFRKATQRLRSLCKRCLSCSVRSRKDVPIGDEPSSTACHRCPLDSRSVALSLNALSKVGERDEAVLRDLTEVAAGQRLQGQDAGLILNALAKMGFRDEALLRRLATAAARVDAATLDAQAVANIANALAKLGVLDAAAMARLSAAARALPRQALTSQAIANIINAFAKLGVEDRPLFAHLSAAAMELPSDSFSPHAVASIVNGHARAGAADAPLFRYLSIAAQRRPPHLFALQAAYNMVNAYDRLGCTDPRLVAHLARAVLAADAATLHELAHVAAAFARLEPPYAPVLDHVKALVSRLPLLAPPDAAPAPPTAGRTGAASAGQGRKGAGGGGWAAVGQDVGMLVSALVKTGRLDGDVLPALSAVIEAIPVGALAAQDVAVIALAVSRAPAAVVRAPLAAHIVAAAAAALDGGEWPASAVAMGLAALSRFPGPEAEGVWRRLELAALRAPAAAFEAQDVVNLLNACGRADANGGTLRARAWPGEADSEGLYEDGAGYGAGYDRRLVESSASLGSQQGLDEDREEAGGGSREAGGGGGGGGPLGMKVGLGFKPRLCSAASEHARGLGFRRRAAKQKRAW